jgi:hypothetical protein
MRNYMKFFIFLIAVGFAMTAAGWMMGAQRHIDVELFGRDTRMSFMSFAPRFNHAANANVSSDGWVTVSERDVQAFSDITVSVVDMAIHLKRADYFAIEMDYPDDRDIRWSIQNRQLLIEDKTVNQIANRITFGRREWNRRSGGTVTIYSPFSDAVQMESIALVVVSGGITVDGYEARSLNLTAVSGGIRVNGGGAETIQASTVSGGIRMDGVWGDAVNLNAVSGGIHFATAKKASDYSIGISTISGGARINGERVSRDEYRRNNGPYSLQAVTVSGGINLSFGE